MAKSDKDNKENTCNINLGSKKIKFKFTIKHAEYKESDDYNPQEMLNKEAEALVNTIAKIKQENNCKDTQILQIYFNEGIIYDYICWIPGMKIYKNIDQSNGVKMLDDLYFQNDINYGDDLINYYSVSVTGDN